MSILDGWQSINDSYDLYLWIRSIFPRNWIFIILTSIILILYFFCYKDKIDNKISSVMNYLKNHRNKLKYLLIMVFFIAILYNINFFSPRPPDDTLLVAIAPFYSEVSGKSVPDNYDIPKELKKKIEADRNLGIDVIILDHSGDVEFQGKNEGAHLVVSGKRIEDTDGYVEIEYNILALTNFYTIPSEMLLSLRQTNETDRLLFAESATYYMYLDRPISVKEPLNENASSAIYAIGAFEKYRKSNFTAAINLFKSVKNYEKSPLILFFIANCYFNNDLNRTLEYLNKSISVNPQFAEAWDNKGVALGKLGRYEEALTAFDNATRINPQLAEAWHNKGLALDRLGRNEEALTAFDNATRINPQFAEAWGGKGGVLITLGRNEEALVAFDHATGINPQFAEAWYNKGLALNRLGRYEEALAAFDNATRINPQYAEEWAMKGFVLGVLGKFDDAIEAFDNATRINPQYAEAWAGKGTALGNLGRFDDALAAFDNATRINPQYAETWYNKGVTLGNLGRYEDAIAAFDNATRINPQYAEAWHNKGTALIIMGRNKEAKIAFENETKINPKFAVP